VAATHVAGVRGDPCGAVRWTHSTTRATTYTCYMYCCHNTGIDFRNLNSVFLNHSVTLTRYRPTPWWWSVKIETCRSTFMYLNIEISISRLIYCWVWSACVGVCQLWCIYIFALGKLFVSSLHTEGAMSRQYEMANIQP